MGGGLLQIVSFGSQDLFLSGAPEITFFKVVYRRHTNFSVESKKLEFMQDSVGFGREGLINIPKIGDLVHKMYVDITLPEVDLKRDNVTNTYAEELEQAIINFKSVRDYAFLDFGIKGLLLSDLDRERVSTAFFSETIRNEFRGTGSFIGLQITSIDNAVREMENLVGRREFLNMSVYGTMLAYEAEALGLPVTHYDDLQSNSNDSNNIINWKLLSIDESLDRINRAGQLLMDVHQQYFDEMIRIKKLHDDASSTKPQFAWVDRIGHVIMDRIQVEIGGQVIERQYGDWLNIWYELAGNKDNQENYYKMIGNVSELTTFDRTVKPEYHLYVPLQFWFCRHSGLSLPLTSLQYHDVDIRIKFREFDECCYIGQDEFILLRDESRSIFLDEVIQDIGIDLHVSLWVDYIYLDKPERTLFARSSHEYLIEQIQRDVLDDIKFKKTRIDLDFVHPCKEMIWHVQKTSYLSNSDGYTKCDWHNYGLNTDGSTNPIATSGIDIHGYTLATKKDRNYYNYVQPNTYHRNTPPDGINMYSFALFPEQYQTTGTINFSRITKGILEVEMDDSIVNADDGTLTEDIVMTIYVVNNNVLRFMNGMGGCAFECAM